MDHTTDTGSEFNEYAIVSDVFHQTGMTASFCKFGFDIVPGIRRKLLDRQAHLPAFFIQCHDLRFMLIAEFEELFRVDWSIGPCDFTYVNQTFYTRHDLKESTIIFDVH